MADTASQRPLWTTLGAALATVVVILGVAAGPTIITCANSADGFGVCIREKLGDIGLLKQSPAPISAPLESSGNTQDMDGKVTAETAAESPVADKPDPVENARAPRLGLVRAEPDGSLVIAGSAAPGAMVEIYANGNVLGRVTAESSGDWVFVPDTTLPAGGVEISVAVPETGELASESVVVVIQDDLTTEPLVVASTPGEASKILQGLPMPKIAETAPPMLAVEDADAKPAAGDMAEAVAGGETQPEADTQTMQMANAAPTIPAPVAEPAIKAPEDEASSGADASAAMVTPENAMVEPSVGGALVVQPSIDAVEVEGARNFFAGGGSEGATIRLYIDDQFIADALVGDGRWLIETTKDYLTASQQRIRIDMLETGTANVVGRAEVDFEILGAQSGTAVAAADDGVATMNATSADNSTDVAQSDGEPDGAKTAVAEMSTATDDVVDMAAPETVPTMTAVQVGDPDDQRFASGKAIIRRGDNLWSIASRVYGSGYRYTTIYRANNEQIRDPNLIYPGQVFNLPEER